MNVLFVTVDSLRADRTSLFDHEHDTTPFLAEFAEESFEFRRAYANGLNTAGSFPSVHCSTYQSVFDGIGLPTAGVPTLAERLQGAGFSTFARHTNELISKEYNYDRGFDTYRDSRTSSGGSTRFRVRLRDAIGQGWLFSLARWMHFFTSEHLGMKLFKTADAVSGFEGEVVDWVDATDGDWFAWAHYMNPHHPYEPPERYQEALGFTPVPKRRATSLSRKMRLHPEEVTDAERQTLRDLYDAGVRSFDAELRGLLETLQRESALEETLVIVTADHGELLGEDGHYGHPQVLRQELVRVPLLVNGPVPVGRETVDVSLLDLAPTVLELAGVERPNGYRGEPLFDREGLPNTPPDRPVVIESDDIESGVGAIRGDRKLVYRPETDRWEPTRLSAEGFRESEGTDGGYDELRDHLQAHLEWVEANRGRGAEIDEATLRDDLAALGYLDK